MFSFTEPMIVNIFASHCIRNFIIALSIKENDGTIFDAFSIWFVKN